VPGLTILAGPVGAEPRELSALAHLGTDATEVLVRSPRLVVAATRYPGYPIAFVEGPRYSIVEGRLYDASPAGLDDELHRLAETLFSDTPDAGAVSRFVARDGEFVVVLVDRARERAIVVTDRHGRLPLYRRAASGREVISRDLGFVAFECDGPGLRPDGVAEFLLFGYPLGDGTVFDGVTRVPPASIVRLPEGTVASAHPPYDFDAVDDVADAGDAAERVAAGLVEACRARAAGHAPVLLSLSGGIDSRMVAGALRRAGVVPQALTHADAAAGADVEVARQVAERLALPWEALPIAPPTGADVERLLDLKAGANYLGMSRVMPYLAALHARSGSSAVVLTGDLGDRLLGDRTPAAQLRDLRALAEYLLRWETILPPDVVASLTGRPREALVETVVARLESYPERTLAQKHVHFLFAERAARWVFEGEDRNRCYGWHTTPFYAPSVFDTAARLPSRHKRNDRFGTRVLALVAPTTADLPNPSTGAAPGAATATWRRRVERFGKAVVFHAVGDETERRLRHWLRPANGHDQRSSVLRLIRDQLGGTGPVRDYLRPASVERLLADAATYRPEQFSVVLTVTSLIDRLGDAPVLPAYRSVPMT